MRKKMVILGAGSAMFTQGLIMDVMRNPGKHKWHLALVDVDEQSALAMFRLAKKMVAAKDADLELSMSTNRRDVLSGADYVVSTIGVGGRRAWEQDVFIPRKYGVYQPVGDTMMPGGISRAMRMVPAMVDVVRDIEGLCPKSRFFNYSNPMAIICRAIAKGTGFPMTGLCIGVPHSQWYISDFAGLDREKVSSLSVGINHMTFMYDFRYEGSPAWDRVRAKLDKEFREDFDPTALDRFHGDAQSEIFYLGEPYAWTFFRKHGAYPAPGDRHITEFFTELFPGGNYYGRKLGIDAYSFEGTISMGDRIHENAMQVAMSDEPLDDSFFSKSSGEHEQLMEIINSIEGDDRKIYSVNLPNRGAVSNLPYESVIEMPAVATATGFHPLQIRDFPDHLAGIVTRHLSIVELAAAAALNGDRNLFVESILLGGYLPDRKTVEAMVAELISVQREYLPQFK